MPGKIVKGKNNLTGLGKVLLNDFLKPRGWTQSDLARKLSMSRQTLYKHVYGVSSIRPKLVCKLAHLFDTTPEFWLQLAANEKLSRFLQNGRGVVAGGNAENSVRVGSGDLKCKVMCDGVRVFVRISVPGHDVVFKVVRERNGEFMYQGNIIETHTADVVRICDGVVDVTKRPICNRCVHGDKCGRDAEVVAKD